VKVELAEPSLGPDLAWSPADRMNKCWPLKRERVKLSVLSTRINVRGGDLVEKALINDSAKP
jgi:hypothetical protein